MASLTRGKAEPDSNSKSYAQQFADLKNQTDLAVLKVAHPKPSKLAQSQEPGAKRVPFSDNVYARREQRPLSLYPVSMTKEAADSKMAYILLQRWSGLILLHAYVLFACPQYFSWHNLGIGMLTWFFFTVFGIKFSYHRQLTHKSFKSPKWLEYFAAWCGCMSFQGGPIEWVSRHRWHHAHTDTPLDPHSPYEGFWWSYIIWVLDFKACADRPYMDYSNATDISSQPYYRFLEATWHLQLVARFLITQVFFGTEAVCWTLAFPVAFNLHETFMVNSITHLWGYRTYQTDDLSTNNFFVGVLALGEGWHNNHHAFPYSARHGLEWWEFDATWIVIRILEGLGLVWDVQLPTEKQKVAKRTSL